MPRLTLVPQFQAPPPLCPIEEVREIIAELHTARDGTTNGPEVLWLINDLMRCCEELFEDWDTDHAGSGPATLIRKNFLSRLTGFAEDIRRTNGEFSDDFVAFIAAAPLTDCNHTAN